jgi:uncharacterized membrane protein
MSVIAAIRPDEVNFPLFLHVLGAMLLVGTLFAAATATMLDWRRPGEAPGLTRFGLRTVLLGVLPAYVLMRIGAQWTESREQLPEEVEDSTWLAIGYITADAGAVLILVAIVLSAVGLRRLRDGRGRGFGRAAGIISLVLLAAYVVAVWAMSTKPD